MGVRIFRVTLLWWVRAKHGNLDELWREESKSDEHEKTDRYCTRSAAQGIDRVPVLRTGMQSVRLWISATGQRPPFSVRSEKRHSLFEARKSTRSRNEGNL